MSRKVQGQGGISLSDIYDVRGGQFPSIEDVVTSSIQGVHDLASTIFSERLNGRIRRSSTGNIAQSTAFDDVALLDTFTDVPTRLLNVTMFAAVDRLDFAQVCVADNATGREVPVWIYDAAADNTRQVRLSDNGAAASNVVLFQPGIMMLPTMTMGNDQPRGGPSSIYIRGQTSAFGAGTVNIVTLIYYANSEVDDAISSYGLPVPAW